MEINVVARFHDQVVVISDSSKYFAGPPATPKYINKNCIPVIIIYASMGSCWVLYSLT